MKRCGVTLSTARSCPRSLQFTIDKLPKVTIQLPLFNERFVVARLLDEISRRSITRATCFRFRCWTIQPTRPIRTPNGLCNEYLAQGLPIQYLHRTNRHGYKAGALQEGLKTATGELIAVFDADFVPPTDFLTRTVHFFADPTVGVVQTRWSYLNKEYNILTQVQAMLLDGHFVLEHGARYGAGLLL